MLPKINHPIFNIIIPSTKKAVKFRPFLVKEEKILLIAKATNNAADILLAIKQIIGNCAIDTNFDVNTIAIFDLEYTYLRLYAASVNNKVKAAFRDSSDEKIYNFEIDLDKIEVTFPSEIDNKISVSKDVILTLKYPPCSLYEDKDFINLSDINESLFELIIKTLDKIYDGSTIHDPATYPKEELLEWIEENIDTKSFEKIQNFLDNLPNIKYIIKYKNSLEEAREIKLDSLMDFFPFL